MMASPWASKPPMVYGDPFELQDLSTQGACGHRSKQKHRTRTACTNRTRRKVRFWILSLRPGNASPTRNNSKAAFVRTVEFWQAFLIGRNHF
jgi:hypothetical protein